MKLVSGEIEKIYKKVENKLMKKRPFDIFPSKQVSKIIKHLALERKYINEDTSFSEGRFLSELFREMLIKAFP